MQKIILILTIIVFVTAVLLIYETITNALTNPVGFLFFGIVYRVLEFGYCFLVLLLIRVKRTGLYSTFKILSMTGNHL
jgi:hypothetical protein